MSGVLNVQGRSTSGPIPMQTEPPVGSERVTVATQGLFSQIQHKASRAWSAVVSGVNVVGESISFIFFRILGWISPSLGLTVENIWLRVKGIWDRIKAAWNEQERQSETDRLRNENRQLKERVQLLSGVQGERDRLTLENNRLCVEKDAVAQQLSHIQGTRQASDQEKDGFVAERKAILAEKQVVILDRDRLKGENQQLISQKDQAVAKETQATADRDLAQKEVESLRKAVATFRERLASAQENQTTQKNIARILQTFSPMQNGSNVGQLLSLLLADSDKAISNLNQDKESLKEIGVEQAITVLTKFRNYLEVSSLMQSHVDSAEPSMTPNAVY